ncbi:hypothetical protein ACIBCD_27100 [Nocardia brasiliensis]|uniref:hypothetical protein n=1 Tax=Nocardia brasiliensis TaxID=37326 RepID=UPI00378D86C9
MNGLAPSLPRLSWSQRAERDWGWSLRGRGDSGAVEAVAAWAAELNLVRVEKPIVTGVTEYTGECAVWPITKIVVWCVSDPVEFEESVSAAKAAAAEYRAARAAADDGAQR